jgi:triosephosphate isomerase
MTRRRLIAGNWKMHGSAEHVDAFADALARDTGPRGDVDLLICPPFVYVERLARRAGELGLAVGGQDVCDKAGPGAYTGEVSAAMLADTGCSHAIVGHSERRALYGEDDEVVAGKFALVLEAGLAPVLCVGETLEQREAGETEEVLRRQLGTVLAECGAAPFERAVIAYEPVWAIGTGRSADAGQAQAAHAFLRAQIAAEDDTIASRARIVYGGSVKPDNAAELFAGADVDGGLVGGASLQAESFLAIAGAVR